jgi:hypothetical protein
VDLFFVFVNIYHSKIPDYQKPLDNVISHCLPDVIVKVVDYRRKHKNQARRHIVSVVGQVHPAILYGKWPPGAIWSR